MTPTCEVCHARAATRTVTLGGVGVQCCAVCTTRSPADVADLWRVRNAALYAAAVARAEAHLEQQRNSGQEG